MPERTVTIASAHGLHARPASLFVQAVTASGAHFGQPGYETDLLYLAALVALVLGGSGPWALDRLWRKR